MRKINFKLKTDRALEADDNQRHWGTEEESENLSIYENIKDGRDSDSTAAQVSSWSQQKKEDFINDLKGDHGNEEKNNESIMQVMKLKAYTVQSTA